VSEQSQEEAAAERTNEPSQPSPKPRTGAEGTDPALPHDPGDIPNPTSQPSPDDPGGDEMQRGDRERERAARTRRPQP
jgi:hypothetical protein